MQFEGGSDEDRGIGRPVVQVHSDGGSPAFLDPGADPSTDLGRLRAQHLPVWTSDFDWAFPPEACDTAWELDGIAEPTAGADIAVLGDFATAAALTVMRYEHQYLPRPGRADRAVPTLRGHRRSGASPLGRLERPRVLSRNRGSSIRVGRLPR